MSDVNSLTTDTMTPVSESGSGYASIDDIIRPPSARPRIERPSAGGPIRIILWVLVPLVVIVLAVMGAELWARATVGGEIRDALAGGFSVEPEAVSVDLGGDLAIVQFLNGWYPRVTANVHGVDLGGAVGDASVVLTGVPVDRSLPIEGAEATVTVPAGSLGDLISDVTGLTPDRVTIGDGLVNIDTTLDLGIVGKFPVAVALQPSAGPASVTLAPVTLEINGVTVQAADIRALPILGEFIAPSIQSREHCVADRLSSQLQVGRFVGVDGAVALDLHGAAVVVDDTFSRPGLCG